MAQSDSGWIREAIQLAQSSTILQVAGGLTLFGMGVIFARGANQKLFGSDKEDKKERDALDRIEIEMQVLSRTNEALMDFIRLKTEGMLDSTDVNMNITRRLPLDELDQMDNE